MTPEFADIAEYMTKVIDLLNEVSSIGVWSKSDDSSDNRRKRAALREADWAASSAVRRLAEVSHVGVLRRDLRALVAFLEPLPDRVTDWMGDNRELDVLVMTAIERAEELRRRVTESL